MIFLRRESFREYLRYYPVTSLILAVIAVLLAAMEWWGDSQSIRTLIDFGAMYSLKGETHEWWRYFTAVFLHIGFKHLLFNGFAIYVFAPPLERLLGSLHYAGFFLVSGFMGNALSMLFSAKPLVTAGASGAIYGVYAAYLYLGIFHKQMLDISSKQTITTILIVGLIFSFAVPEINLFGHLGGFIGGFVYFALLTSRLRRKR